MYRVHTGFEWNKYNQTHYDMDNPPPKIVQGYKFNIFYPDLINKGSTPQYFLVISKIHYEFTINLYSGILINIFFRLLVEIIQNLLFYDFMLVPHMKILHLKLSTENGNIHIKEDFVVNFITIFFNYGFISNVTDIEDSYDFFLHFFFLYIL